MKISIHNIVPLCVFLGVRAEGRVAALDWEQTGGLRWREELGLALRASETQAIRNEVRGRGPLPHQDGDWTPSLSSGLLPCDVFVPRLWELLVTEAGAGGGAPCSLAQSGSGFPSDRCHLNRMQLGVGSDWEAEPSPFWKMSLKKMRGKGLTCCWSRCH